MLVGLKDPQTHNDPLVSPKQYWVHLGGGGPFLDPLGFSVQSLELRV